MSNPFSPQEPPEALFFERANNAAIYLGGISYGIHISVFFMTIYYILNGKPNHRYKQLIFVGLLFALGTMNICINMRTGQLTWIDNRNYPGGPFAYLQQQPGEDSMLAAGNAAAVFVSVLADGLLIYRCHALYQIRWLVVVPILGWLASFVCGILLTVQASAPGSSLFVQNTLDFSIPYFCLTMGLNILLTILLIVRLMHMGHQLRKAFGKNYAGPYRATSVMLVESALPYGVVSLVFLGFYVSQNSAAVLFVPLLVQVECIAPMVIVLRVAAGKAWSKESISATLNSATLKDSPAGSKEEIDAGMTHVIKNC